MNNKFLYFTHLSLDLSLSLDLFLRLLDPTKMDESELLTNISVALPSAHNQLKVNQE